MPLDNGRSPPPSIEQVHVLMGAMIFILMGSAVGNAARLSLDASPTALQRKGGGARDKTQNCDGQWRKSLPQE